MMARVPPMISRVARDVAFLTIEEALGMTPNVVFK